MDIGIAIDTAAGDTRRVLVSGKLDTHTHTELDRQLAPLLETAAIKTLVLDLDKLNYISSAGIRTVFKARKAMAARGGRLLVVHLQPQIRKVFDIVKAVPVSDVFASAEELDAYLDAMQRKVVEGNDDGP